MCSPTRGKSWNKNILIVRHSAAHKQKNKNEKSSSLVNLYNHTEIMPLRFSTVLPLFLLRARIMLIFSARVHRFFKTQLPDSIQIQVHPCTLNVHAAPSNCEKLFSPFLHVSHFLIRLEVTLYIVPLPSIPLYTIIHSFPSITTRYPISFPGKKKEFPFLIRVKLRKLTLVIKENISAALEKRVKVASFD